MPWIFLAIGGLAILAVLGAMLAGRRADQVNVNVSNPPASVTPVTPVSVAVPVTVVVTATSAPATPIPAATAAPKAEPTSGIAAPPTLPPMTGAQAAPTVVTPPATAQAGAVAPTSPPVPTSAPPTAPPTPTAAPTQPPFRGEVAPSGGLGNTRQSLGAAYGPPPGETPGRLVVYRQGTVEYQVLFSPDPARALLVARVQPTNEPLTLDATRSAVQALLPSDAERRTPQPEGNDQFVVERYRSAVLARALDADIWREWGGQPGDLLVVYWRASRDGQIERVIVAVGDNVDRVRQRALS